MSDSDATRSKRSRLHRNGDHSLCTLRCASKKLAAPPASPPVSRRGPGPSSSPAPGTEEGDNRPTPIRDAVLKQLQEADCEGTANGQLALDTARTLDHSHALVGRAPLVRELRDTLSAALAERPSGAHDEIADIASRALARLT